MWEVTVVASQVTQGVPQISPIYTTPHFANMVTQDAEPIPLPPVGARSHHLLGDELRQPLEACCTCVRTGAGAGDRAKYLGGN